jgi:hypothetical protein
MSSTNKFASMLSASNNTIKTSRAEALAESTILEVDSFINSLKKERHTLKTKITSLTDLAPDNTYSLRPGSANFDAVKWMTELHTTKMQLELLEVKIKVAEDIHNEWFAEEATPKKATTKK